MLPLASSIRPGMKGAFYGRHSTDKQNMDTQRSMAFEFAYKYNCTVVREYLDAGVSARTRALDDRPGVSQLLNDAIDSKFDFVMMNYHDRMARNPMEHQKIRMTLTGCNIPVVIISSESLYDSGDFIVDLIKDGTSKLEVDNTRIRTRDTSRSILKQGKWTGGKAPFGYRYDIATKTFSKNEQEISIVRRVYELYRNREGFQSIASIVSHEFGTSIKKSTVRWIITNPFYAGYLTHQRKSQNSRNSITSMDTWLMERSDRILPIMSLEEWKETWIIFEQRKSGELSPNMYKTSFLLSNLVTCTVCNKKLIGKDQNTFDKKRGKSYGNKWYRCPTCKYKIDADRIHLVVDAIINDLKSQNLENVSNLVYEQMLADRHLVAERLNKAKSKLTAADNQLQLADTHAKRLAAKIKDLETIDDNTNMVQVLTLQKQLLSDEIKTLQSEIIQLDKSAQYLEAIEGHPDEITRNIKSMSVMTNHDNQNDIRKMITYLVQQAFFTPITINSKSIVSQGDIAIQTRSSLIRTIIS